MDHDAFDLLIVGGGVNGAGIARDAAGRGLSVALVEMGDLAQGTSSASTKLIHGGLRYLEHGAFGLVRESLDERAHLLRLAPHLVTPMRFVLPHRRGMRPAWMLRLGLFLYDRIGGAGVLPGARRLNLRRDNAGAPLRDTFRTAFEYSDAWVDDARLVVLNAVDAAARGARILTRTRLTRAWREGELWVATLDDGVAQYTIAARALVNAAGPWIDTLAASLPPRARPHARLVQGSHIVVRRLFDHDRAYLLQNDDGRIVFAIPYERDFTLIGTTDRDCAGDPAQAQADDAEVDYLLRAVAPFFSAPPQRADVVWRFSGVRALVDDGSGRAQSVTREYRIDRTQESGAPLIEIFGGKITTYRHLAERALGELADIFPAIRDRAWTTHEPLPGGDFARADEAALIGDWRARHPWLGDALAQRWLRAYGTRANALATALEQQGAGRDFGAGLCETEARFLVESEFARTAADILWRRSKRGLHMRPDQRRAFALWFAFTYGEVASLAPTPSLR